MHTRSWWYQEKKGNLLVAWRSYFDTVRQLYVDDWMADFLLPPGRCRVTLPSSNLHHRWRLEPAGLLLLPAMPRLTQCADVGESDPIVEGGRDARGFLLLPRSLRRSLLVECFSLWLLSKRSPVRATTLLHYPRERRFRLASMIQSKKFTTIRLKRISFQYIKSIST